jgi:hypothetical protein
MADGKTMTNTSSSPSATPIFAPAPRTLRLLGAIVSLLTLASGLLAAFFAVRTNPEPLWAVAGLQVLVVLGGCFGLAWSFGRFVTGPVLALLCAAGAVLVGGMLCFVANRGVLGPVDMKWWTFLQVLLASTLGSVALASALTRDPLSYKPAIKGVLLSLPAIALLACVVLGTRLGIMAALAALPTAVRIGLWLGLGFVASVMLCMAAHHLATAFGRAEKAGHGHAA